ncbi:MAG: isoleucine--tRNA ligase [Actinomycetota bacterium]|nr:isoleucine--tRNA ligase [Actinomycetota bacterium]
MKGNLPRLEPELLDKWAELKISAKLAQPKQDQPTFILHDGPPYANGDIHLGHTLNKVLKDIIVRSKAMAGHYSPFVPGWDCHGQPIEHEVEKRLGRERADIGTAEIRRLCREYALKFVDRQRGQFKRLGVGGIWDEPYLTLDPGYEATVVRIFNQLYQEGLIYRGRKPIHWCYRCKTALAEAEIEYEDEPSPSIYIKFPLLDDFEPLAKASGNKSLLVWTTTPWTLPANVAVAVNPNADYAAVSDGRDIYILADALVSAVEKIAGRELVKIAGFKGESLVGLGCKHPTKEYRSPVVAADFVALDQGTGCVHIAPGHGEEDYLIGQKYNLPSPMPVDENGRFTEEAGALAGLHIIEANDRIIEDLKDRGILLMSGSIDHSYPHCWRCKQPVIFRATEQWFVSMDAGDLRQRALRAIQSVKWVPDWSIRRISGMVSERPDWCISRQRSWGVPIPIIFCGDCGQILAGVDILKHIEALFRAQGADVWFAREPVELLPPGTVCPKCSGADFRKENDILDVWFESGVSHAAVLETRSELSWPADLYLEGSDQHRGWFQSSLLTSVGTKSTAPYREVLTHGFLVDGEGRKMSKSLGNVIDPLKVIERSGADILRLWVCSADYSSDIAISDEILDRISEAYRRVRNTLRFLLGSLADFDPARDKVDYADMEAIDKWVLIRMDELIAKVLGAYEDYRLHIVYHSIYNFCTVDLSSFYLDVSKDRLYTSATNSKARRSAQTAIFELAESLIKIVSPVLVFTADEAWSYLPDRPADEPSVHLSRMPVGNNARIDMKLKDEWGKLLLIRQETSKALEAARTARLIGSSLEAKIRLSAPKEYEEVLTVYARDLAAVFIVSQVELVAEGTAVSNAFESQAIPGVVVEVDRAQGHKCARCWNWRLEVGENSDHPELCGRCLEAIGA